MPSSPDTHSRDSPRDASVVPHSSRFRYCSMVEFTRLCPTNHPQFVSLSRVVVIIARVYPPNLGEMLRIEATSLGRTLEDGAMLFLFRSPAMFEPALGGNRSFSSHPPSSKVDTIPVLAP